MKNRTMVWRIWVKICKTTNKRSITCTSNSSFRYYLFMTIPSHLSPTAIHPIFALGLFLVLILVIGFYFRLSLKWHTMTASSSICLMGNCQFDKVQFVPLIWFPIALFSFGMDRLFYDYKFRLCKPSFIKDLHFIWLDPFKIHSISTKKLRGSLISSLRDILALVHSKFSLIHKGFLHYGGNHFIIYTIAAGTKITNLNLQNAWKNHQPYFKKVRKNKILLITP
jgi:hypothetical protein